MLIRFLFYGVIGWCMEIVWTGFNSLLRKDFRLISTTSVWMFFIYGMAIFLEPISKGLTAFPIYLRGGVYVILIFAVEYLTGTLLGRLNMCPWDYSGSRFNINGVVRLDYAPVWFVCGLTFEFVSRYISVLNK